MQIISYRESFVKARQYFQDYNQGCITGLTSNLRPVYDLGRKLRSNHRDLLFVMFRLYAKQLLSYELLHWREELPPFHTNSNALAKVMDCNPRTIRRLIHRLIKAEVIIEKEPKGRRHNYLLRFAPEVMVLRKGAFPKRDLPRIEKEIQQAEDEAILMESRTSCPQLDSSQKKKNNRRGGNVEKASPCPTGPCLPSGNRFTGNSRMQNAQNPPTMQGADAGQGVDDENRMQNSRSGMAVTNPPPGLDFAQFEDYYMRLFSLIVSALYSRLGFLATSQVYHIRRFLLREFAQADPEQYPAIYQQLRVRVLIAQSYVQRKPGRFIPIPQIYFDLDNPNGFARTQVWYEDMRHNTSKIQAYKGRYETMMKAWGGFMSVIGQYVDDPGLENYSRCRDTVKTKYGGLVRAFDYVVLSSLGHNQPAS